MENKESLDEGVSIFIEDFVSRRFINNPTQASPSVIVCSIQNARDFNIQISDCRRSICLHEFITDKNTYENSLYKLTQIKEAVEQMLGHLDQYKSQYDNDNEEQSIKIL